MASKPEALTFSDVTNVLSHRITIASCTDSWGHRIKLTFTPHTHCFRTCIEGQIDNVYSLFGTQMAIDRYNELIGAN